MSNPYYNVSGWPAQGQTGDSASARAELAAIQTGFNLLPNLSGNGGYIVRVNAAGTALEAVSAATATLPVLGDANAWTDTNTFAVGITAGSTGVATGFIIGNNSVLSSGIGGIWNSNLSPSNSNYNFAGSSTNTYVNASGGSIFFQNGGSNVGVWDVNGNLFTANSGSLALGFGPGSSAGAYVYYSGNSAEQLIYGNAYNPSGTAKFSASGYAGQQSFTFSSGAWTWATSTVSGSAGGTVAWNTAMTLDASGNLELNQTTIGLVNSSSMSLLAPTGNLVINHANGSSSGNAYMQYGYNGIQIGSISQSGTTAVLYNTTSDKRLKTNITTLSGSGAFIDALQPRAFNWISDGSSDQGFIADEFQTVAPKAVTGQPNAVDANGKPVYQAIDASTPQIIANLVAEIQSIRSRLNAAHL